MRLIITLFILNAIFPLQTLLADTEDFSSLSSLPTLYKGRYLPLEVYAKNFLIDNQIAFSDNPLKKALLLHIQGYQKVEKFPYLMVEDRRIQSLLKLDSSEIPFNTVVEKIYDDPEINLKILEPLIVAHFWEAYDIVGKSRITLSSLNPDLKAHLHNDSIIIVEVPNQKIWRHLEKGQAFYAFPEQKNIYKKLKENLTSLLNALAIIEAHQNTYTYTAEYEKLYSEQLEPSAIHSAMNQKFPLYQRLATTSPSFYMLADKTTPAKWHPLKTIHLLEFDEASNSLVPISNFTAYTDDHFKEIQKSYAALVAALPNGSYDQELLTLSNALNEAYQSISNRPYRQTSTDSLFFPSTTKLFIENSYTKIPWTLLLIISYTLSIFALLMPSPNNRYLVYVPLFVAVSLHTCVLLLRSYILGRPPVSNMTETMIFVPWVSVLASAVLAYFYNSKIPLMCASACAAILFSILKFSGNQAPLENVQAVLNSQFWLTIHVLMVVGSYGAFLLSGILGHLFLLFSCKKSPNERSLSLLNKLVLQSMYIGLALLIPGTILGGVWAAQSWGRFWDWDPKEAWAFISCCTYLVIVHSHYFGLIRGYGIAVGSVIGLMVIAFTWYGVNYILGTGLHSYGFGNGGEYLFYLYLFIELIFLAINSAVRYAKRPSGVIRTQ